MKNNIRSTILLCGVSTLASQVLTQSTAFADVIEGTVTNDGTFLWEAFIVINDHTDTGEIASLVFDDVIFSDVYSVYWTVEVFYGDNEIFDTDDDDFWVIANHTHPDGGPHPGEADPGPTLEASLYDIDDGVNVGPASDNDQHHAHTDTLTLSYIDGGILGEDKVFITLTHPRIPGPAPLSLLCLGGLVSLRRKR